MYSIKTSTATGNGDISKSVSSEIAWQLEQVTLHLSAAGGANNLTATINKGAGAAYDTVLVTQDMTLVTDFVYVPDKPILMQSGDTLDIAWTNGSSRTYGLEVTYTERE